LWRPLTQLVNSTLFKDKLTRPKPGRGGQMIEAEARLGREEREGEKGSVPVKF